MKQKKINVDIQQIVTQLGLPAYPNPPVDTKKEPNATSSDSNPDKPSTNRAEMVDHLLT